jgi:hypothetical protein
MVAEGLAVSFYVDGAYSDSLFFQETFERLKSSGMRITDVVQAVGRSVGEADDFLGLWRELSSEWVHTKGLVDRTIDYVSGYQDVPPWGLTIPMQYTENDLGDLAALKEAAATLRRILKAVMERTIGD